MDVKQRKRRHLRQTKEYYNTVSQVSLLLLFGVVLAFDNNCKFSSSVSHVGIVILMHNTVANITFSKHSIPFLFMYHERARRNGECLFLPALSISWITLACLHLCIVNDDCISYFFPCIYNHQHFYLNI